ncbi:MAG: glycosyltransferase [Prevotella sp.]|nr:glycosyltransferase [Prevotella sp.]
MIDNIKVSIITVCYNSEKYIEQTIQSVLRQTYGNIEYIVVDGMSTDSTPAIIERYADKISKVIRGKDKNMYDAINKGMVASTGDYIEILNSDDMLSNEHVIENTVKLIDLYKDKYEVFYGDDQKFYQDKGVIKERSKIQTDFKELLCSQKLTFVGHGAVFISRKAYESIGEYDCDRFWAAADYDYLLRLFRKFPCKHIKTVVQTFRVHGSSITSSGRIDQEIDEVLKKNGYYNLLSCRRVFEYYKGWTRFWFVNLQPMIKYYVKGIL